MSHPFNTLPIQHPNKEQLSFIHATSGRNKQEETQNNKQLQQHFKSVKKQPTPSISARDILLQGFMNHEKLESQTCGAVWEGGDNLTQNRP